MTEPMSTQLPAKCFISHAYADVATRDRLIKSLPSYIAPIVFPPITVRPHELVSTQLIETLLSCDGLSYLSGGSSDRSFWVAFERDYAIQAGKQVFSADVDTLKVTEHTGSALDLAVFPSYVQEDRSRVSEVADFLKRERHFNLWSADDLQAGENWRERIYHEFDDRLERGYGVAFWSRSASVSQRMRRDLERAARGTSEFNDRVLFALLDDVPPPAFWLRFQDPAVQLYGDAERAMHQRWDDLVVRLYWLLYRKTVHRHLE